MQSIEKAIDILEAIINRGQPLSLNEIAHMTGINITTAHRICATLVKRGYLYQSEKRGKYSVGLKYLQFNDISSLTSSLAEIAIPYLKKLSQEIGETTMITVREGNEVVHIATSYPEQLLRASVNVGSRLPLYCTSLGKVLLAYMNEEKATKIIDLLKLKARTKNTVTDKQRLKKELAVIRKNGYAIDNEENAIGVRSVAAPVRAKDGNVIASISFAGASVRVSKKRMLEMVPLVQKYALDISRELGYKGKT